MLRLQPFPENPPALLSLALPSVTHCYIFLSSAPFPTFFLYTIRYSKPRKPQMQTLYRFTWQHRTITVPIDDDGAVGELTLYGKIPAAGFVPPAVLAAVTAQALQAFSATSDLYA